MVSKGHYKKPKNPSGYTDIQPYIMFSDSRWFPYVDFVLRLFNATLESTPSGEGEQEISCKINSSPKAQYSIITLNYDLVLEKIAEFISNHYINAELRFARPSDTNTHFPFLAKLHGSLDNRSIVPPTWNKSINPEIEKEWECAYDLLGSANHIRIIGYLLPISDAYIRYLFKASILKIDNPNLKSIDVLCYQKDGNSVQETYDQFIQSKIISYQFLNKDVKEYLQWISRNKFPIDPSENLIDVHNRYFKGNSGKH